MPLICNFVLPRRSPLVSWSLLICWIELLNTPVEYENADMNSHEKRKAQKRFVAQEF